MFVPYFFEVEVSSQPTKNGKKLLFQFFGYERHNL